MFFTIELYLHLNCVLMLNWIVWNRIIFGKMDLALNNLQRLIYHKTQPTSQRIYIYIYIYISSSSSSRDMPLEQIELTLSCHFSLSVITSGRSSGLHPVSSHSRWMYIRAGRPVLARPYIYIYKNSLSWDENMYIYIYCHPQTDCFVLSELFSVARPTGRSKPGSKPV